MPFSAEWTRFIEHYFCIQCPVSSLVCYDAPVIPQAEIRTLKYLVPHRANKNKFHFFCWIHAFYLSAKLIELFEYPSIQISR